MTEALIRMAGDPSPEGRQGLLQAVTDWYLPEPDPSPSLKDDYAFIATYALRSLSDQDRVAYARRVAPEANLPRPIVWMLATDGAMAVAHPVLKHSPVLTDDDLATIAATQSDQHRISVATRAALAPMTTDVLAELGSLKVLRQISGNGGAQFSHQGITRLMERAGQDPDVTRNLARRALRRPERQAEHVLRAAPTFKPEPAEPARVSLRPLQELDHLIAEILSGRRILDEVILMLVENDQAFELAAVLGAFAQLQARQVLAALFKPEADDIARLCRAIDLSGNVFGALLTLRAKRLTLTPAQTARERHRYDAGEDAPQLSAAHPFAAAG